MKFNSMEYNPFGGNGGSGSGDMIKSIYDPTNTNSDAFDMDNMNDGSSYVRTENNYDDTAKNKVDSLDIATLVPYIGATSDVNLGKHKITADALSLNNDYTPTGLEPVGTTYYNKAKECLTTVLPNALLQNGRELYVMVLNQTGQIIPDGSVVAINGADGMSEDLLGIPFIADGSINDISCIGLATHNIPIGGTGKVTCFGVINKLNTIGSPYGETWTDGDVLYASATTAGALTKIPPEAPNMAIKIGEVVNTHATVGLIFVKPITRSKLTDLYDVDGTPLTEDGQIMTWDNDRKVFDFTENINDYTKSSVTSTLSGTVSTHITDNTNPHTVTKAQVGLSNVVNVDTSTTANIVDSENKRFVTDTNLTTLSNTSGTNSGDETTTTIITKIGYTPENIANKDVSNGYCGLDSGGKVPLQNLPSTLLKYIGTWNAETNTPSLTATDLTKVSHVYVVSHDGTQFGITWKAGDWLIYDADGVAEKSDNSDDVVSVNGKTGIVVIDKADVGLSNVDNTSDLNKPISTLTQTALNLKADDLDLTTHTTNTSNPHGVTKSQVGLNNVANVDTTTTANITDSENKRFVNDIQRTLLNNTSKSIIGELPAVILSTEWTGTGPYEDTIPVVIEGEQITNTTHDIKVSLVLSSDINVAKQEQEAYSYFSKGEISATNTLKITCFEYKPTVNLNLTLEVVKKW